MSREAPSFWWEKAGWKALALSPLSALYGAVAGRRLRRARPPSVAIPVLCIGNLIVGGAGKTPTAIAFAQAATAMGLKPGFVSRGYGGQFKGTRLVDPDRDNSATAGDEPMLLRVHAPVAVSADRHAAARLLQEQGCDFLIMDDGFQSARLHIDFALIVIDARRGIGNGRIVPGGPVRAPLNDQLLKLDAVLKIGKANGADGIIRRVARAAKPIYEAVLQVRERDAIEGRDFLAFAGIGDPQKFFDTIEAAGGKAAVTRSFPDHHPYSAKDMQALLDEAKASGLQLITTSKDYVRLFAAGAVAEDMRQRTQVLDIKLSFDRDDAARRIITETIKRCRQRMITAAKA